VIEPSVLPRKNLFLNVVSDVNYLSANPGWLVAIDSQTGNEVWHSPPLIDQTP
jgi:glucose dehydrogenase